ncbi:MAG: hypothetical protein FWE50_02185 [Alphaproteobacteria bacterium]|nr:hypothetical protein [Alphaproteobacteria bacterium]
MNRFFSLFLFFSLFIFSVNAASPGTLCPRVFSTSTDWESVTGLRYAQFNLSFVRDNSIGSRGMEIYFLDSFPCTGQAEDARQWISPSRTAALDSNASMGLSCVQRPEQVRFAWREVPRDAFQNTTTGIIICDIPSGKGRNITIKLQDCTKGKNWNE